MRSLVVIASLFVSAQALAQAPKELVGRYQMDVEGGDVLELRADGTASMAGDETKWSAKGGRLTVGTDTMAYQLAGGRLTLTMGSVQMAWKRLGAAGKGPSPMEKAAAKAKAAQAQAQTPQSEDEADREAMELAKAWLAQNGGALQQQPPSPGRAPPPIAAGRQAVMPQAGSAPGAGSPQDQKARQVLMSSAWCSFTYNQHTGTSTTRKVVFRPDGVMTINGGAETYNSGSAGTVAGQYGDSSALRWKLEGLRLFVDQGDGNGWVDVGLSATQNSNGSPILHQGGREYSMCQ